MSYTGNVVEIPLLPDGLTGSRNAARVRPGQLLTARTITYEAGTLQKEGGATKYNATAISGAPKVIGGWDWWPTLGTQRMVVITSDGNILKDSGGGTFGTTLKSGLSVGSVVPVFVDGGQESGTRDKKLFIFTEKNQLQVLAADGATAADIGANKPADWTGGATSSPICGVLHEGRLWGFLNHRAYYSTTGDHEDFTGSGSGSLAVFPGEGERIVRAESFKGAIIVFKFPRGVYVIDTSNATASNWRVTRATGAIGCASPQASCLIDNDILFMDENFNFQLLSMSDEVTNVSGRNLSEVQEMGPFIRDNVALGQTGQVRSIYYAAKREAHFAVAATGATVNSRRIIVDFLRIDEEGVFIPRFRWSDLLTCESLWLKKDSNNIPRPMAGDDAGFVWNLDQTIRSKDGAGYSGEFQTGHHDFSHIDPRLATVKKNGDFLELVVEPKGNWNLSGDIYWDGELVQTVPFNMGVTGAGLGSFTLDVDRLATEQVLNKKKRIAGGGRRFSFGGRNSGAGEDYSVARVYLHFGVGDERL